MTAPKARLVNCAETGAQLEYRGYGRPPKYLPEVAARRRKDAAKAKAKTQRDKLRAYVAAEKTQQMQAA